MPVPNMIVQAVMVSEVIVRIKLQERVHRRSARLVHAQQRRGMEKDIRLVGTFRSCKPETKGDAAHDEEDKGDGPA